MLAMAKHMKIPEKDEKGLRFERGVAKSNVPAACSFGTLNKGSGAGGWMRGGVLIVRQPTCQY